MNVQTFPVAIVDETYFLNLFMKSLAATPSTFALRDSATTRTVEHRRRASGTSQFGQKDRGREAPHRGPCSGAPAARR